MDRRTLGALFGLTLAGICASVAFVGLVVWLLWDDRPNLEDQRPITAPAPPPSRVLPKPDHPAIVDLEGGWGLNPVWQGYMGVAIHFHRDGTFDYWHSSDVVSKDRPKYPVGGRWKWEGDILELTSEHHLHDTHWYVARHDGQPALLPAYARLWQLKDGNDHADRLLFRVPDFDPTRPFEFMMQAAEKSEPVTKR